MSSNDKRDLTTKANDGAVSDGKGKAGSAIVYGDIVTLPPDADDVIFTTICDSSISGVVDAEVEMSYDKENWCPAVTEEFTAGSSVTGWGNQKYIDLVPTGGEYKNKHAKGTLAFDASGNEVGTTEGTRDVLYNFMQKNKPFNINWWHKSETVPNTVVTTPAVLGVEKAIHTKNSAGYGTTAVEPCGANQLTPTSTWSISYWVRADASANAYHVHLADTGLNVRMGVHGGTKFKLQLGSHGLNYTFGSHPTIFANDTDWHHIVVTCDGQSTSTTDYSHGSVNSNHKVYIDGVFIDRTHVDLTSDYTNTNAFKVNSSNFAGSWTDISFWNVDLSSDKDGTTGASSKIQSLYNSGVPTDLTGESGLVTWYRCGDNASDSTSTIANNATSYSNDGMTLTGFNNTANGEIVDIGSGELVYQAFVPEVTANNYNPIIFRQGNKDPFSNEKYLNLSKGTGEYKNKYLSAPANTSHPNSGVTHAYNKDDQQHELRSPSNPWGSGNFGADQAWSYSFWLRTNGSNTGAYAVIGNAMDSSGTHQSSYFYLYRQGTGGELRLRMGNASNTVYPTSQSSHIDIFDNNWHHVVLTCDGTGSTTSHTTGAVGSNHKLYIDGVFQVASSETTGTIDYGSLIDKMVISRAVASVNKFEGYFAEVSFWTTDLSSDADSSTGASSKIQSLYNLGVPTNLTGETGLYAWYKMGATSGDSGTASPYIQDVTGNSTGLIPYPNIWSGTVGDSGAIHALATTESIYKAAMPNTDIFHSKMGADKSFTINTWFNSSVQPTSTDYSPVLFNNGAKVTVPEHVGNTKATKRDNVDANYMYFSWGQPSTSLDSGSGHYFKDSILWQRTMPFFNWTLSFWFKIDETLTDDAFYNLFGGSGLYSSQAGIKIKDTSASGYQINIYNHTTYDLDSSINLEDGGWHHIALCNDNTNINQTHAGSTSPGNQYTNKSGNSQVNVRLFVDGIEATYNSSSYTHGWIRFNGKYNSTISGPQNNLSGYRHNSLNGYTATETASNYGFHFGKLSSNDLDNNLACSIDEFSLHKVNIGLDSSGSATTTATISELYNSGVPTDFSTTSWTSGSWATSDLLIYMRMGDQPISGDSDGVKYTSQVSCKQMLYTDDANGYQEHATNTLTAVLKHANGSSANNSVDLTSSDSIYDANISAYDTFGNGLTASFTKKLGSGTTWNTASTETTKLLLSFDGFEDRADAFNAYDASSLLDGNWHNLQLTWDGSSTNTEDVKVFADGVELSISDSGNNKLNKTAADKHFKYTTGTFVPGTFGASGWKEAASTDSIYAFQGSLDNLSLHSEVTTLAKAQEFYGKNTNLEGKPHNYQMSNTLNYSNVEGWWTFDEAGDSITVANDRTSNNIDLTLNNFVSGGNGLVAMSNSDSIYLVNPVKGEGFTVSITRNLKSDGTWVESQDQVYSATSELQAIDAYLVLSFNGFESAAEYWVAYKTNQAGLSPAVNLLDGLWHSVTISYAGTTDNSGNALSTDEIRFGPTQVSGVDQPFHFQVAFDGQVLESINSGKGYNLAKGGASGVDANAGFVIENKHLRHENSVATYIPTTYLASGIAETAGANSIYAFQGGFDESSFHSDSWWASSTDYNQEKPLTIYGISSALSNPIRRSPYNLRSPATIEVDAATLPNQYIDPNPTSATNTNGGLEVYYRWGDTTGDCSQSIRDVKSHETSPASLNRDIIAHNIVHEDAVALDTDASESTTYAKDLTYNDSGTNKMYVAQSTETTLGGLSTNAVKISGCGANTCQQQGILSAKLPHMRVKWSGSGSCDLGEDKCRAQLWFRRRRK